MLSNELLHWLFKVLQPEYKDPKTTYQHVAVLLTQHATLKPRTRVFTYETGEPKLLLSLYGSLPVPIGQATYKIPIELWLPHEYGAAAPMCYVVPTSKMIIQPGNYVDSSGKCYLPLLANWTAANNLIQLADSLIKVFAIEPPVYAKPETPVRPVQPVQPARAQPVQVQPVQPVQVQQLQQLQAQDTGKSSSKYDSPPPLPPLPKDIRNMASPVNQQAELNKIEIPNIMDSELSIENKKNSDLIQNLEQKLNEIYKTEVSPSLDKFSSHINKIKYSINQIDEIFKYENESITKINNQINKNTECLNSSILKAQQVISQSDTSSSNINIDEIIVAETVVFNQIYELVAEDLAISDTIYTLSKAFDNGNISLANFTKFTRSLAREQFIIRSTSLKIAKLINLNLD